MKQINVNGKEVLMCEAAWTCTEFKVNGNRLEFLVLGGVPNFWILPKGDWHLLGLASDIKEEQWAELVECWDTATGGDDYQDYYRNYSIETDEDYMHQFHYTNATESGLSLLKAHGYNPSQCILLIKK